MHLLTKKNISTTESRTVNPIFKKMIRLVPISYCRYFSYRKDSTISCQYSTNQLMIMGAKTKVFVITRFTNNNQFFDLRFSAFREAWS